MSGKFEAIKYALRQNKDGTVVSFVVHPNDCSSELNNLPIGARVEIEWTKCTDEEPASGLDGSAPSGLRDAAASAVSPRAVEDSGLSPKERKRFSEMPLAAQAGMRCGEPAFQRFLRETKPRLWCETEHAHPDVTNDEHLAAEFVRNWCATDSRKNIVVGLFTGDQWIELEHQFQTWLTEAQHGALVR